MKSNFLRCISTFLAIALLASFAFIGCSADNASEAVSAPQAGQSQDKGVDYIDYLAANTLENRSEGKYVKSASEYSAAYPADSFEILSMYEGKENSVLCEKKSERLDFMFDIKESGYYSVKIAFYPLNLDTNKEEISLYINDKLPFVQAKSLFLNYNYVPEKDEWVVNDSGDEYAPRRVINQSWTDCVIVNPDHDSDGAMKFRLEKGVNKVSVVFSQKSNLVLGEICLEAVNTLPSYKEYIGNNSQSAGKECIYTEAENVVLQSDSTVIPVSEQTDPLCSPYSVNNLKINTIGSSWAKHGQWLEWKIDVKQEGWYNLSVRYKQNSLKGINVKRSLSIDGAIPFAEAAALSFPYTSSWRLRTLCDDEGNAYSFYLKKGEHTIRMESVMAELADIIKEIDGVVYEMNAAYRSVVMVTSNTADKYRDYQIEKELPDLVDKIKSSADKLEKCNKKVEKLANGSSADSAILVTTAAQMRSMVEDPDTIPYRLSSWESNIGSVSSWALSIREQPLQMDYFIFTGKDYELPKEKANFFEKAVHAVKRFFISFIKDYSDMNGSSDKDQVTLSVWVGTGRDQAEVLWQMTDELFTPESKIRVKVKLVSATMIEAFLSGQAPDLTVQAARDIPVNLAVRGALLDLASFEGFNTVEGWFAEGALVPYTFQNCVYGLPDSQSFNMLFYRTDVFEELGLKAPDTWDEFINVANQLHLKQLDTGIPVDIDISMYYTLLMQNNGKVFTDDLKTTLLDTQVSIDAFTQWTQMFTETGLPISYNLFNRFRSGEMPMVIAPYINYNQLISAAPEIRNLWKMTCIPGTVDENGNINRTESATGTAAVILASTAHPEESWEFLRWWVGDTAQIRYAQDIESRVGTIGRVASANTRALEMMDYSDEMGKQLMLQRNQVVEIPQVPGNYYLDRDVLNAFRDVLYNDRNAKESILDYSNRINNEIARKREELGIE